MDIEKIYFLLIRKKMLESEINAVQAEIDKEVGETPLAKADYGKVQVVERRRIVCRDADWLEQTPQFQKITLDSAAAGKFLDQRGFVPRQLEVVYQHYFMLKKQ